jgi:hypothetical protein
MTMATKRAMATAERAMVMATRVAGKQQQQGRLQQGWQANDGDEDGGDGNGDGNGNNVGDGNSNEAGGRQRGKGQGQQGRMRR